MRTKPMNVTRRESLRLLGSGLAATSVSLPDRLHDAFPAENALDRVRLLQLLGTVPASVPPLAAERVERTDLGDVVREKVTYTVEPGERVPAFVLLPKPGPPRHPAILCHHQHGGEFAVGKDGPAGRGSDANQPYALELAPPGYVSVVFDALCFHDPQDGAGQLQGLDYGRRQAASR